MKFRQSKGCNFFISWTMWLVIELDRDIVPISIRFVQVRESANFFIKNRNFFISGSVWLVIKPGWDIVPINTACKFDKHWERFYKDKEQATFRMLPTTLAQVIT